MFRCYQCGKRVKTPDSLCSLCAKSQRNGQLMLPNGKKGEQLSDAYGRRICKICGRTMHNLGSHLKNVHDITAEEYKQRFGLNKDTIMTTKKIQREERRNKLRKSGWNI